MTKTSFKRNPLVEKSSEPRRVQLRSTWIVTRSSLYRHWIDPKSTLDRHAIDLVTTINRHWIDPDTSWTEPLATLADGDADVNVNVVANGSNAIICFGYNSYGYHCYLGEIPP
jgi:hypothetical protein